MNKKPVRSLDNLFAKRIIPIEDRVPFVHAFDDYEQAVRYIHNVLSKAESTQIEQRISELTIEGVLEVERDIEQVKEEAREQNFTDAEQHIQYVKKSATQRWQRFLEGISQHRSP